MGLFAHLFALGFFVAFVLLPGVFPALLSAGWLPDTEDTAWLGDMVQAYSTPIAGIIHAPSALFIGLSAAFLLVWPRPKMARRERAAMRNATARLVALQSEDGKGTDPHVAAWQCAENDPLVRKIIDSFLVSGSEIYLTKRIDDELRTARAKLQNTSGHLAHVAGALPMLGMLGTIAGLMFMFYDGGGADVAGDAINRKFAGMSTALLTTLYAASITVFLVKPWYQSTEAAIESFDSERGDLESAAGKAMRALDTGRLRMARPDAMQ